MPVTQPIIPSALIGISGETAPTVPPSSGSVGALIFQKDWGPMFSESGSTDPITSYGDFVSPQNFGDTMDEGGVAALQAFLGSGLPGASGVGGLIPLRIGTGAAYAQVVVNNASSAPALTLRALWKGTRGNNLSIVIDDDPTISGNDRLQLRYGGNNLAVYSYPQTDIAGLVAAINATTNSQVVATATSTGTALTATASTPLAGGLNGTVSITDYTSAVQSVEFARFGLLSTANLTDAPTIAALRAWADAQLVANRPVRLLTGGDGSDTLTSALNRSVALASENVGNLGIGTYLDDVTGQTLTTAKLAPRIMGMLASLGEKESLTGKEIAGLHPVGSSAPNAQTAEQAIQGGVIVLIRTDSPDASVKIADGVSTYTSRSNPKKPYEIFSDLRIIGFIHNFVREARMWGDKNVIGKPNDEDTRKSAQGKLEKMIAERIKNGLILTKAQGAQADPYATFPVTTGVTIPFKFGFQPTRTTKYLLGDGAVR